LFKKYGIQAILCPSGGTPALDHGKNAETMLSIIYYFMWNILDFPAGVLPVCKVEENE
jgi:fatty acid amide hydrolase